MNKALSAAILAIFGIIMMVGLLASQAWNPSWNPFISSASGEVVKQSLSQLFSANSFAIQGEVEISGQFVSTGPAEDKRKEKDFSLSLNFKSDIDRQNPEDKKSQGAFDLQFQSKEIKLALSGEVKSFEDEFYLRLTNLPVFLLLFSPELETLKGQWVKLDEEELQGLAGQQKPSKLDKQKQEALKKELTSLIRERNIFKIKSKLRQEKVGEDLAEHYLVSLSENEIKELIPIMLQTLLRYSEGVEKEKLEQEVNEFLKDFARKFDRASQQIGEIVFELWVDKLNNLPLRVKLVKEIDLSKFEQLEQQLKGKVNIALDLSFSKFGEKIKIEPPLEFKSLQEFLGAFGQQGLKSPSSD